MNSRWSVSLSFVAEQHDGPHRALVGLAVVDRGLVGAMVTKLMPAIVCIQDLSGKSNPLSGLNLDGASAKELSLRRGTR